MSEWIEFVRAYSKKNNISYPEALKKAGPEYRKTKGEKDGTKKGEVRKTARRAYEK